MQLDTEDNRILSPEATTKGFYEFFAGIGLVHQGLLSGGWECLYANDIDIKKYEMYEAAFPECRRHFDATDIWEIDAVLDNLNSDAVLATASFPCTDLSVAGHYRGINGKHSSTFFAFAEIIERLRADGRAPSILMLENVRGFLTSHGGDDFDLACRTLASMGYLLDAILLDAKHFTPQSRPRVFVLAFLPEAIPPGTILQEREFCLSDPWELAITARPDVRPAQIQNAMRTVNLETGWVCVPLSDLPGPPRPLDSLIDVDDDQKWWGDKELNKHLDMMSAEHRASVERYCRNGGAFIGTIYRRKRHGAMRAEVRFDGLAGCLRTAKGGSARQIVIAINKGNVRMRWMSPREYARLQGADNFPICVSVNQALTGFGDAVCVPAISWIDENVLTL